MVRGEGREKGGKGAKRREEERKVRREREDRKEDRNSNQMDSVTAFTKEYSRGFVYVWKLHHNSFTLVSWKNTEWKRQ